MLRVVQRGNYNRLKKFLEDATKRKYLSVLNGFGERGVAALTQATPVDTGETAASWSYTIELTANSSTIAWTNNAMAGTVPKIIILQYGHGTRQGGYVQGIDYINPAIQPVFDQIAEEAYNSVIGQ